MLTGAARASSSLTPGNGPPWEGGGRLIATGLLARIPVGEYGGAAGSATEGVFEGDRQEVQRQCADSGREWPAKD